jgi:hypothetical protein
MIATQAYTSAPQPHPSGERIKSSNPGMILSISLHTADVAALRVIKSLKSGRGSKGELIPTGKEAFACQGG